MASSTQGQGHMLYAITISFLLFADAALAILVLWLLLSA